MSSGVLEPPTKASGNYPHYHIFHADADVLSGDLKRPIQQRIETQPVHLKDRRGGHLSSVTEDFSLEGYISFKRGITRVSGAPSSKPVSGHEGWTTLSTSVLEDLNVFEIITADRVVSQVSTDHAYENGHVPRVTFLGTQLRNLQISGFPATVVLNLGVCERTSDTDQPNTNFSSGDQPYVTDKKFLATALEQAETLRDWEHLPKDLRDKYTDRASKIKGLMRDGVAKGAEETIVICSVIRDIIIDKTLIPGLQVLRNLLVIPEFGTVTLGEIEVKAQKVRERELYEPANGSESKGLTMSHSFKLTMLDMHLGCVGDGSVKAAQASANGHTKP